MRAAIADWPRPPLIIGGEAEKFDAFAAANAALAASGTVGLELAMAATPHVVSYRMNPFSAILARIMVKAEYVHLVNLVLGEEAVPEFLLGACRPGPITESMHTLLSDQDAASRQTAKFEQALGKLGAAGNSPGEAAAEKVLELMRWSDSGAGG
jgi:lipid-A-disaccharide synthase